MYLGFIVASAFLDILANLFLKKSNGFESKFWGFVAIVLAILAFVLLYFSLEYVPLSIAYSTWGAVGIIGTCLGGWIFYKEKLNFIGILGIIVVITAVILLNL
ncbi:QacE family quaternary ammonium compound efflux SMR transporter [Campylobacter sp. MIT 99-7217]|uniref:DMT family transporter n=1 Tax=Campylobacter sp. MIT 99-7217 TaxID=535091 RepID=UPI001158B0E7|nr:SMR family transporter [Campylobacter sp. MIT 99-7217]TQR34748.1 QacE family quaternary ammonium compound efflux SMR transporter [Campylobacter sp. MIT 99-7217]